MLGKVINETRISLERNIIGCSVYDENLICEFREGKPSNQWDDCVVKGHGNAKPK
jgi:hypothetical protein